MDEGLEELVDEVRLLWHALVAHGERLHAAEPVTLGQRAVLEFLVKRGPSTVPAIARSRGVSRQHVQTLVNPLQDAGWITPLENPAHKRSPLMSLTPDGERLIRRMRRREGRALEALGLREARLRSSAQTLRKLRDALQQRT